MDPTFKATLNRRHFLKLGATTGVGAFLPWPAFGPPEALFGVSRVLAPFVDPLPIPSVQAPTGTHEGSPLYEIAAQQVQVQIHRDLPPTTIWGYNGAFPGPTLRVNANETVHVRWINDLRDESGTLRTTHILPVDTCLHGPRQHGNAPRLVTHLHGGHTPAASDGFPEHTQLPGENVLYTYPNGQEAATLWYHDHAMGITRLNVYMGLMGLYTLTDTVEAGLNLPQDPYDVPLILCDRAFNADGSLSYPANWQQHFFGDVTLVNGKAFPFFTVEPRKYRFRLLNGSNARTYTLQFDNALTMHQIGSDGGFLDASVALQSLTLSPAERADVIVDFTGQTGNIVLTNTASAPYTAPPGTGSIPNVLQFRVAGTASDTSSIPGAIRPVPPLQEADAARTRTITLGTVADSCVGQGIKWTMNGLGWTDVTEIVELDSVEIWEFVNPTTRIHPMHIHLNAFQILDRTALGDANAVPVPPAPNEAGWKDTVLVNANETVRIITKFEGYTGTYVYHCHILEHEDHEMMRQLVVVNQLPVEFADFYARVDDRDVHLFWQTATETNNAGFNVEMKRDDVGTRHVASLQVPGSAGVYGPWESIAFIDGHGTTRELKSYTYRLADLGPGAYRFRLKQVDFDGTSAYSPEVEVFMALPEAYRFSDAYPNPFSTSTSFSLTLAVAQQVLVAVFDSLGRRVALLHEGVLPAQVSHRFSLAANGLPNGTYIIRASGEHVDHAHTVVLQR